MPEPQAYTGGFVDPAYDSARAFRAAMNSMARPGSLETITGAQPPKPLSVAAGTLILTLCDPETGVALRGAHDDETVRAWISFHTGAPFVEPPFADFVIGTWDAMAPLSTYKIGTPEYPDRSATLIIEQSEIVTSGTSLSGPGIRKRAALNLPDQAAFAANNRQFPLGVDCYFTAGEMLAALPRSTRIEEAA